MIQINLLPVKAARKREFGKQQLVLFGVLIAAAIVGNYLWLNSVDAQLQDVEKRIASTRAEIAQLEKTIGEVKSIKDEKKALEDKLKILDTLKKGRTGPVKVLDELTTIIPQRVWLRSYQESAGGVQMEGNAAAYEDLSAFSKKLKGSKHFSNVVIKHAAQHSDGVVEWVITCNADYSA